MSAINDISQFFKVVVIGDSGVGKTAMILRLIDGKFCETSSTIGVQYQPYICQVGDERVQLQIWDTAGQERYRSISKSYFRNAVGAILVFDVTNALSFDSLSGWLQDLQQMCAPNAFVLLVGNKIDNEKDREIGYSQAFEFAQRNKIEYMETSALSGNNIQETFVRLAFKVYEKVKDGSLPSTATIHRPVTKDDENQEEEKKECNC